MSIPTFIILKNIKTISPYFYFVVKKFGILAIEL